MPKPGRQTVCQTITSPVGPLTLAATDRGLAAILWQNDEPRRVPLAIVGEDKTHPVLVETERQLAGYFAGRRTTFSVPLDVGGTAFQASVWRALLHIPFGETRTYGEIARSLGRPDSSRAVGAAVGRNPISIIVPCHRVIGSTGKLTGFAGGLPTKAFLLDLEGASGRRPTAPSAARPCASAAP